MGKISLLPLDKEIYEEAGNRIIGIINAISKRRESHFGDSPWKIEYRIKSESSIEKKLARKRQSQPSYSVGDMTDLIGVRVIVENLACARVLAEFVRQHNILNLCKDKSESFIDPARKDGYRGIHLILSILSPLPGHHHILAELQIRTLLQHQWSILSHSEFYKSFSEIPANMVARMRALSDMLYASDVEAEQLRKDRVLDECMGYLVFYQRRYVLEKLSKNLDCGADPDVVGRQAITLLEIETHLRRALVSADGNEKRAIEALVEMNRYLATIADEELVKNIQRLIHRVVSIVEIIPANWK
jgi:ppGpp synthetase/RelA/SpoT-type nucleotidyltranferase